LRPIGTVQSSLAGDGAFGGWVQGVAGNIERDSAQAFNGNIFDTSYEQDYQGVQGGLDYQSGGTIIGVSFGYGKSEAEFEQSFNRVRMDGYNLGAYAAFQSGGLFVNAIVKRDWIAVGSTPGAGLLAEFDASAWGLRATAGYRFHSGNVFIEPSVSLSWVDVDIDDYSVGGASVAFDNIESVRGSLGVRLGGDFRSGSGVFSPFVGIHAIDEFSGEGVAAFSFGQTIGLRQDAPGTYGEVQAGLAYSAGRLEVFARGEYGFGREREGLSGRAGVRLRF
jgi:outer membrane autotransporter protein